ncbi:hypothetical protein [Azorhizophilus paspali]|uniref:hypothetical protein n=1 Tax=Azorhizophilus paspali TaxID=69963 RepID=UPI00374A68D2
MAEVTDIESWLIARATKQQRFVIERGADVYVWLSDYEGPASGLDDDLFLTFSEAIKLFDLLNGQQASGAIIGIQCRDDRNMTFWIDEEFQSAFGLPMPRGAKNMSDSYGKVYDTMACQLMHRHGCKVLRRQLKVDHAAAVEALMTKKDRA